MNEQNRPRDYFIPANITDNGSVIGKANSRNVAEMVGIAAVGFLIAFGLLSFLSIKIRLIVFAFFMLFEPLAYNGFRGEPLLEYFIAFIYFRKKRRIMKYKLPRDNRQEKKIKRKEEEDKK